MESLTDAELLDRLRQAAQGLLMISESDYPFEAFVWEGGDRPPECLLDLSEHPSDCAIETVSLDYFFRNAVRDEDWYDEAEWAAAQQYRALVERLQQHLKNIQVYRIGAIEIDVYIVGLAPSGHSAGLKTKVIET